MKTENEKEGGAGGARSTPPSLAFLVLTSVPSVTLW